MCGLAAKQPGQLCYLVLLAEVHAEDLGVAQGPLDPVDGGSGGDRFICRSVLRGRGERKNVLLKKVVTSHVDEV